MELVLWLLIAIWGVYLAPVAWRSIDRRRSVDSVGAFRHHLAVLERTTPAVGSNVRVLRPAVPMAPTTALPSGPAVRRLEVQEPHRPVTELPAPPAGRRPSEQAARPSRRVRMRRVHILRRLLVAMGLTLVLGLVPALRFVLVVHLVVDVLFVAYLGMLVHLRTVAAEREEKVHYLAPSPAVTYVERRSAWG